MWIVWGSTSISGAWVVVGAGGGRGARRRDTGASGGVRRRGTRSPAYGVVAPFGAIGRDRSRSIALPNVANARARACARPRRPAHASDWALMASSNSGLRRPALLALVLAAAAAVAIAQCPTTPLGPGMHTVEIDYDGLARCAPCSCAHRGPRAPPGNAVVTTAHSVGRAGVAARPASFSCTCRGRTTTRPRPSLPTSTATWTT